VRSHNMQSAGGAGLDGTKSPTDVGYAYCVPASKRREPQLGKTRKRTGAKCCTEGQRRLKRNTARLKYSDIQSFLRAKLYSDIELYEVTCLMRGCVNADVVGLPPDREGRKKT
jgi:hypothetical protein